MRHRHLSNPFTRSGTDQHDSNHTPVEQSYTPTGRSDAPENGPPVGLLDHTSRDGVQRFVPVFSGSPVDPHSQSQSSITHNTSLAPVTPIGHIHCSNYNIPSTRDAEPGPSNCTTGVERLLKRKRPDISGSCERGSSSSFYSAGSSSSSSQMPMEKPSVFCRDVPPYRDVRRRSTLELEPSHPSRHYQSTTHPANRSVPVQPADLDATSGQWNSAPRYAASAHRRISPPDVNGLRHETTQLHVGGSSQYPHGPSMREGHGNQSRRVSSSYGNGPSYSHYAHGGTSSTSGPRAPPENFSSRYSRHCSAGGWRGNYRSGRPRIAVERSRPIHALTEAHAQTIMLVDRTSFFGSSSNFSDEYRDLRLDIDNMSYEELLNLGERMGNVSTGLSEDSMSKCLTEKIYSSSDQNHAEISCPICLEEYEKGDKVGMVENCGHDYHADCIKKWLLMKKVCPICKSECSNQG